MPILAENYHLDIQLMLQHVNLTQGYIILYLDCDRINQWNYSETPRQQFWQFWRAKYTVREAIQLGAMAYQELQRKLQDRNREVLDAVKETRESADEINQLIKAI